MSQKLQELTEKLYNEGVKKARYEAEAIRDEAAQERDRILADAEKKAASLVEEGRKEAEQLVAKGRSELKMASRQAVNALKQNMVELLTRQVLREGIHEALADQAFLKDLIRDLTGRWDQDAPALELPASRRDELDAYLRRELAAQLDKGLEIRFEERMKDGFRVVARDGSWMLSFTDEDFESYFRSFVKEKTRDLLFAGD